MPPVLFSVYTDKDGTEMRRCVDGKQRLSSITGFFNGQVRTELFLTFYTFLIRCCCRFPVRSDIYCVVYNLHVDLGFADRDPVTKKQFWFLKHESKTAKKEVPEKFKKEFREKIVMCGTR